MIENIKTSPNEQIQQSRRTQRSTEKVSMFLYSNTESAENHEIRPIYTSQKKKKWSLRKNLAKQIRGLYNENYKILLKEIEDNKNKNILPKAINSQCVPNQLSVTFFTELEKQS